MENMGFSSVPFNFLKDVELLLLKGWTRSIFPIPPTKHRLKPWILYIKQTQDSEREDAGWLGTSRPKKWLSSEFSTFSLCLKYVWLGTGEASNLKMQWVQKKTPRKVCFLQSKSQKRSSLETQPLNKIPSTPSPPLPPSAKVKWKA